jgi:hypothetical protein
MSQKHTIPIAGLIGNGFRHLRSHCETRTHSAANPKITIHNYFLHESYLVFIPLHASSSMSDSMGGNSHKVAPGSCSVCRELCVRRCESGLGAASPAQANALTSARAGRARKEGLRHDWEWEDRKCDEGMLSGRK